MFLKLKQVPMVTCRGFKDLSWHLEWCMEMLKESGKLLSTLVKNELLSFEQAEISEQFSRNDR